MTSEIWITKRSMDYSIQKLKIWGVYPLWSPFNLTMARFACQDQPAPYLSTQKSAKWWIYPLRGSFDHRNGLVYPSGPTSSIVKKSVSAKDPWTIAYENWQNRGLTRSRDHLTLKMGRSPNDPWTIVHKNRQNERFTHYGAFLTLTISWFTRRDEPTP
ncbi:hypothetical protein H5410_056558 [Solanum commersonii]|uniref:Uncharacterized protein n=1 Tax=Solanum commersonii TaxID=4109 RepID=A0A9J5WN09_SOLCO|nr:hypothetical protein H5410_056558 [Solanum commersonii]